MTALTKVQRNTPALRWQWRDAEGNFHYPDQMVTRHLFHTIRMIWNHSMPPHMRTGPHRRHSFMHPIYTTEYMQDAIRFGLPELLKRQDITPQWRRDIEFMRSWFYTQDAQEIKPIAAPQRMLEHGQGNRTGDNIR